MAQITRQQFGQLMQNAPKGTDPKQMMDSLIQRGHTLEGYTPPTPQKQSYMSDVVQGAE